MELLMVMVVVGRFVASVAVLGFVSQRQYKAKCLLKNIVEPILTKPEEGILLLHFCICILHMFQY
jgi:hypothetical protein